MSKSSELFERIAKRCPFPPAGGNWQAWISAEMAKTEDLEEKLIAHRRKVEDETRRHRNEMTRLAEALADIQKYCPHETMKRSTAECEPQCDLCGWTEEEYRRS